MKPSLLTALIAGATLCVSPARGADTGDEQALIAVLESDAGAAEKDAACARLKRVGTERCVPAVAALLSDPELSHSARYVLEAMSAPEAGSALLAAVRKSEGTVRLGIVNSLGARREARAVGTLTTLLAADPATAAAAATALGHIGGEEALQALQNQRAKATDEARSAMDDGILGCARQLLDSGQLDAARAAFKSLHGADPAAPVRAAAYQGLVLASGKEGLNLVVAALRGDNTADRLGAVQCVRKLQVPGTAAVLAGLLPDVPPQCQVALLAALGDRGDPAAAEAVTRLLGSDNVTVRDAAVAAIAILGSADQVPALVEIAATTSGKRQRAVRQVLTQPLRGDVTKTLVRIVISGSPAARLEAARTLVRRGAVDAVPALLPILGDSRSETRDAASEAVGRLAGSAALPPLVDMVVAERDAEKRALIARTVEAVCRRVGQKADAAATASIVRAMKQKDESVRLALLPSCSHLASGEMRLVLRRLAGSPSAAEAVAVRQAMCETRDPGLLPDVLDIARATIGKTRTKALRGVVRLVTTPESALDAKQRCKALARVLDAGATKEEKWLALSGLAKLPTVGSLDLVLPYLNGAETRAEAARAIATIAEHTAAVNPGATMKALERVLASAADERTRAAVEGIRSRIRATASYLTAWEVSGPYLKEGRNYAALFDIAFPPETPGAEVKDWRPLPAATDPERPWLMDLLKAIGGHQRVAYVRAQLVSEKRQPVRLEIGSDDGIKVWLNGKLRHANNTARPIRPGSDKVRAVLREGRNDLMIKITQNIMGWEYCVRVVKPDGAPLDGIPAAKPPAVVPAAASSPLRRPDDRFLHKVVDRAFRSEGVAVADFDGDGQLDIATGNVLYKGPDWKPDAMLPEAISYKLKGYSQEFLCFADDINNDSRPDLVVVGFPNNKTWWLKNPGKAGGRWSRCVAVERTGNESPHYLDADGDGRRELLFMSGKGVALARPGEDTAKPWVIDPVGKAGDPKPGHGLGVGDINGDGRNDILCPHGWWEQPANGKTRPWTFHRAVLGKDTAQLCVYDVDGDGDSDVVSSSAHRYGLWWYEQTGDSTWRRHDIDNSISQLHALHLADINGDGLHDIVTGKRFWAHNGRDPGGNEPAMLCWYELQREGREVRWVRHDIDADSGVGLHFRIVDLNGDGRPDIVTSNKKGVHVFVQNGGL